MTSTDISREDCADTEITIAPDGRVFVHGLSREVVEVLGALDPRDAHVARVLEVVHHLALAESSPEEQRATRT